jgi:uncharacterized protein (DUF1684 family)
MIRVPGTPVTAYRSAMRRFLLLILLTGCADRGQPSPASPAFDTTAWRTDVAGFFATRDAWLPGAYGPLAQTGLCRLELPRLPATIGSDSTSACIIPGSHAPASLGTLVIREDTLRLEPAARVFWVGAKPLRDAQVLALRNQPALDGATAWHGPVHLTARWDSAMVTVWIADTLAPARDSFAGIERWPLDPAWRFHARFEPASEEWRRVETVRGFELPRQVAGRLTIEVDGRVRTLTAYSKGRGARSMLVVLRDATSGQTSYPAGRFLDVPLADSTGHTVVDFNLARNPDCAFTVASPCPLPPRENWFDEELRVGEMWYRHR